MRLKQPQSALKRNNSLYSATNIQSERIAPMSELFNRVGGGFKKCGSLCLRIFRSTGRILQRFSDAPLRIAVPILAAIAFIINSVLELCHKNSFFDIFSHIFTAPLVFAANLLIILLTLSLCLFLKRKLALMTLVSVVWILLGVTSSIVQANRGTALSAADFRLLKEVLGVINKYFTVSELIMLGVLLAVIAALLVLFFIKCPKGKVNYKKSLIAFAGVLVLCLITVSAVSGGIVLTGDTTAMYHQYGFPYGFTNSIFVQGIAAPDSDMQNKTDAFLSKTETDSTGETGDENTPTVSKPEPVTPNIIVVQLESFFDVKHLKDIEFSRDPVPNFTALKNKGISGFLNVVNVGGGTANIEFEFLTGMNIDHFGLGEFPYTTLLNSHACESLAYNLKTLGYTSHAIHNHIATFYSRNTAYASLGFDTFTPIEMMTDDVKRNILGWASDSILVDEIRSALDSTDGNDFVFTVSVQGHGGYPDHSVEHLIPPSDRDVDLYGFEDEKTYYQYHFYTYLIRQMDDTIGEICNMLDERGEPYLVVFYGDHLPAIPLDAGMLDNGDMYQTEYVIKTNTVLPAYSEIKNLNELDRDLETYQLSAYIQKLCGLSVGDITKIHQSELDTGESLDDILETVEYRQLSDDTVIEFEPTEMAFGTRPITVGSYKLSGTTLTINGSGFNRYSKAVINGIHRNTVFVSNKIIKVENVQSLPSTLDVLQVADDGTEFAYAKKP